LYAYSHLFVRSDGLTEFKIPNGLEMYGMTRLERGQFFAYLYQASSRNYRMSGEMPGKNRMRCIETDRKGCLVSGDDTIEIIVQRHL
jgi:hypothetical protein